MQDEFPDPLVILIVNLREVHFSIPAGSGTAFRSALVAGKGTGIPFLAGKVSDAAFHQHIDIILNLVSAFHRLLNIPGFHPRGLSLSKIKFEAGNAIGRSRGAQADQQLGFLVHGADFLPILVNYAKDARDRQKVTPFSPSTPFLFPIISQQQRVLLGIVIVAGAAAHFFKAERVV
jgi:hypothetical protein